MTPMVIFMLLGALMLFVALALIVVPLMRQAEPAPLTAGAVIGLLPLAVVSLYFVVSNWSWDQPEVVQDSATPSVSEMVSRLEQRLQENPDDAEGWQMLGRSYVVLSRYPEAVEAYGRARELTDDSDEHALTGYAESLAMVRGGIIDNEIAALFERVLELSPDNRKALWYGGLAAFEGGRAADARARWKRLLALDPPEQMVQVLREQIAAADAILGGGPEPGDAAPAATGVSVQVTLAPALQHRVRPDAPVFILARQVDVPGPPLAVVRRQASDLPLRIFLSDADAMVPGLNLSAHETVEIVARIALGGTPTAQAGDLSGSDIVPSSGETAILIDRVVQ